jgi:hypothetical protein
MSASAARTALVRGVALPPSATPEPPMPTAFQANAWRRMSQLSRAAAAVACEALEGVEREGLGLVWGTSLGEIEPTVQFLERWVDKGPERVSPLAFQTSVYNAPASHLSIALGLTGPGETLSAGGATGLAALLRGVDWIRLGHAPRVLVVAAEPATPFVARALALSEVEVPAVGFAAAVLLDSGEDGPEVEVGADLEPSLSPVFGRSTSLPDEAGGAPGPGLPLEALLGFGPAAGLAGVVLAAQGGGSVVDVDGPSRLVAVVRP